VQPRTWTDAALIDALGDSRSVAEVLRKLNLRPVGGNYLTVKVHMERLGLTSDHLLGKAWARGARIKRMPVHTLEEILVEGSTYANSARLKDRLVGSGLLEARCTQCGLTQWNGRPAPLELDHVNGDRRDNRLSNLRLLCPNCHAQTPTYRGKKNLGGRSPIGKRRGA
jgi:hypothetical protein